MTAKKKYRALTALMYPASAKDTKASRTAEVGDVVDDIPAECIKWMLAAGFIEVTDADV